MAEDMLFFKHITMKQPEMQSFPFILSLGQEVQESGYTFIDPNLF